MTRNINTAIIQSELEYRSERARNGLARRRKIQEIKRYAARKLS